MTSAADAIHFALTEAARFQEALRERRYDVLDKGKMDVFCTLPAKDGRDGVIIGADAQNRLYRMLSERVRQSPYSGRLDLQRLLKAYKREISLRFVVSDQDITDENAELAFEAALAPSLEYLGDFTHLIPCHLVIAKKPDQLAVGPVLFRRRDAHWPAIEAELGVYFEKLDGDRRGTVDRVAAYYAAFDWMAEVRVSRFEVEPSREIAERMAWSALDCLQLLIGQGPMERMTLGGVASAADRRSHVTFKNGKVENVSTSWRGNGITLDDEVWQQTELPDVRRTIDLMGVAVSNAYNFPDPPFLAERFVDAVHWFGMAMRDTSAPSQLIMLLMAVERLVLPTKVSGIESSVRFRNLPFVNWDRHGSRVKKIYDVRGQLAHGQLSGQATEVIEACRDAQKLAKSVLFEMLHFFGKKALSATDVTPDRLAVALDDWAKHQIEHRKRRG